MRERVFNISLVGVGGQGILLTSEIAARTAALAGMDVKKSEIHGMAQRGGSVISQVRFGVKIHSPIIMDGRSDLLVAFELHESLRWRHLLPPDGEVLINNMRLVPVTVASGQQAAFEDLEEAIAREYPQARMVEALAMAVEAGNKRAMNMVIAGALSTFLPFDATVWESAIRERVPEKTIEVNLKAFQAGVASLR